ncbi:acyl carrier protein [Streptomyces sp. NPDC055239]
MSSTNETSRTEVFDSVRHQLADEFSTSASAITYETVILEIEGADSVKQMRLANAMEQRWDVVLMAEETPIARSVADLVAQILASLSGKQEPTRQG